MRTITIIIAATAVLFTSCLGGEDEFKNCDRPFDVIYRTQLITNEDNEIALMLHDNPMEEMLAPKLKAELGDIFTFEPTENTVVKTKMPDLQLCFYRNDTERPEVSYHLVENVGAPEKSFPTELSVLLPYWHAALCGVEANKNFNGPVAGLSHFGREHAPTLALYQPEAALAYSHRHGVYTGRVQIPSHGEKEVYYCNLYQVNSAVAAVIDPGEVTFDSISAFITRTADRFDVQDSIFTCNNPKLNILCNRLKDTGSKLVCLWGACLPCPTSVTNKAVIDKDGEGAFDFIIEIHQKDVANNRTKVARATCHVKYPLLAAELKILKFRLKKNGDDPDIECVNAEVGISLDIQWHEGLGFEVPLL